MQTVYTLYHATDPYYGNCQPLKTFKNREDAEALKLKFIKAAEIYDRMDARQVKIRKKVITVNWADKARRAEYDIQRKEFERLLKIHDRTLTRLFNRLMYVLSIEMREENLSSYTNEEIPPYIVECCVHGSNS